MLGGKLTELKTSIGKWEKPQINNLNFHVKNLKNEKKPKARRKEIIKDQIQWN